MSALLLASPNPRAIEDRACLLSPRKRRLFLAACCRRMERLTDSALVLEAVELAEGYADGDVKQSTIERLNRRILSSSIEEECTFPLLSRGNGRDGPSLEVLHALLQLTHPTLDAVRGEATDEVQGAMARGGRWQESDEREHQLTILTDIAGPPGRNAVFDPSWRSDNVMLMATQAYEQRDYSVLPILADALQDAGCADDELLAHLRDESITHTRGCWALDLILELS